MGMNGLLTDVRWEWTGTEITADLLAGEMVLPVLDPESVTVGELVWVLGTGPYEVVGVDVDDSTFTILPGLEEDADSGSEVVHDIGGEPGKAWIAEVIFQDNDTPIEVPLTVHDLAVMPEGTYDPPKTIIISDDYQRVIDLPGSVPVIDGIYIPPDTIAPVPSEPPAVSPIPEVFGTVDGLVVTTDPNLVDPGTMIEYHISTQGDFVADGTTLVLESSSNVVVINTLPDGTPLQLGVTYYVQTIAKNVVGEASPSAIVAGELDEDRIAAVVAAKVVAGFILAGSITVGNITIDPDTGITIAVPGGSISLPANGIDSATFDGDVVARNLTAQHLKVLGAFNFIEGILTLADGINPPAAPRLSVAPAPAVQMKNWAGDPMSGTDLVGLSWDGSSGWFTCVTAGYFWSVHRYWAHGGFDSTQPNWPSGFAPYGGIVKLGSDYFVLGRDFNRSQHWYIYKFDSSWTKTGEMLFSTTALSATIGTDGSRIITAHRRSGDILRVSIYTTGLAVGDPAFDLAGTWPSANLTGVVWDTARSRVLVASTTAIRAYTTAGARVTADDVARPSGNQIKGLGWDGTRLHVLDSTGKIHALAQRTTGTVLTATVTALNSAGTVETTPSTATTIILRAGQYLQLQADPLNDDGDPLKPSRVQFYVSAPTTRRGQGVLAEGVLSQTIDVLSTGGPIEPTSNGFDAYGVTPGAVRSDAFDAGGKLIQLHGDGRYRLAGTNIDDIPPTVPTFTNGWVSPPSAETLTYERKDGVVYILGVMKSGTINQPAFTLPPGCRPSTNTDVACVSNSVYARLKIFSSGVVTPITGSNAWYSITASFPAT